MYKVNNHAPTSPPGHKIKTETKGGKWGGLVSGQKEGERKEGKEYLILVKI